MANYWLDMHATVLLAVHVNTDFLNTKRKDFHFSLIPLATTLLLTPLLARKMTLLAR